MTSRSHYVYKLLNIWTTGCEEPKEPKGKEPPILITEWDVKSLVATDPSTYPWKFCWLSDKLVAEVVKKVNINKRKNITLDFDVNGHVKKTRPSFGPAANEVPEATEGRKVYDFTYRNYYRLKGETPRNEDPNMGGRPISTDGFELYFYTKAQSAYSIEGILKKDLPPVKPPKSPTKKKLPRVRQPVAPFVKSKQPSDSPEHEEATDTHTGKASDAEHEDSESADTDNNKASEQSDNSLIDDIAQQLATSGDSDQSIEQTAEGLSDDESRELVKALTDAFTTSAAAQALVTQQFKSMARIARKAEDLPDQGCRYMLKCLLTASENCQTLASQVDDRLPSYIIRCIPERFQPSFAQAFQMAEMKMHDIPLKKVSLFDQPAKHYDETLTDVLGRVMDLEGKHLKSQPPRQKSTGLLGGQVKRREGGSMPERLERSDQVGDSSSPGRTEAGQQGSSFADHDATTKRTSSPNAPLLQQAAKKRKIDDQRSLILDHKAKGDLPPGDNRDPKSPLNDDTNRTVSRSGSDYQTPPEYSSANLGSADHNLPRDKNADQLVPPNDKADQAAPPDDKSVQAAHHKDSGDQAGSPSDSADQNFTPKVNTDQTASACDRAHQKAPGTQSAKRTLRPRDNADRGATAIDSGAMAAPSKRSTDKK